MNPSAYADTFARDHLPPPELWPDFVFERPEYTYPDRLNCVSELLDRWLAPGRDPADTLTSYNEVALLNLGGKIRNHLAFFTDVFPVPPALVLALLAAVLMLALVRARRRPSAS